MKTDPLRKRNIYVRPEQKAAIQLAAANAGMSVSAWGRSLIDAALAKEGIDAHQTAQATNRVVQVKKSVK